MTKETNYRQIDYLDVRVNDQSIAAMKGHRAEVVIPAAEIRSMKVVLGSEVQHPLMLLLFGIGLVGLGLLPVLHWLMGGILVGKEVLLLIWPFLGSYAIFEAVKKKPLLLVETTTGRKKITFRGSVERQELEAFIEKAKTEFGYIIDSRLNG